MPLPTVVPSADTAASRVAWRPPPAEPTRSGWTSVLPESALLDGLADWWEAVSAVPVLGRLRSVRPRSWVLGGLVLQIVALSLGAGFIISSTILFTATACGFGRSLRSWGPVYGLVLTTLVYLFFTKALSLSLPMGPLEQLLG